MDCCSTPIMLPGVFQQLSYNARRLKPMLSVKAKLKTSSNPNSFFLSMWHVEDKFHMFAFLVDNLNGWGRGPEFFWPIDVCHSEILLNSNKYNTLGPSIVTIWKGNDMYACLCEIPRYHLAKEIAKPLWYPQRTENCLFVMPQEIASSFDDILRVLLPHPFEKSSITSAKSELFVGDVHCMFLPKPCSGHRLVVFPCIIL